MGVIWKCLQNAAYPTYSFRTGALAGGTGAQANAYAYFAAPGPPAAGTYKLVDYAITPPGAGEARLVLIDGADNSSWSSQASGGTITVAHVGGKPQVSWTNKTLVNVVTATKTATSSGLMRCK